MKNKRIILISLVALSNISLSGCFYSLSESTEKRINRYPGCQPYYLKHHFSMLERATNDVSTLVHKCMDSKQKTSILKKYPTCEIKFNESHEAGIACSINIESERKREKEKARQEELEKKKKAQREYLASPAGKRRLEEYLERKRNLMPICNKLAIDVSKKYNVGKYIETLGGHFMTDNLGICFIKYIGTTVTGHDRPNIIEITFNLESGNYKVKRNN